jgi:AraC-like DNA-binding protein
LNAQRARPLYSPKAAARLPAVKTDIDENLDGRELTIALLARRHRVSTRCIQLMFETAGTTFSEFVLVGRLDLVHRSLSDRRSPPGAGRVAVDAGGEAH